MHQPPAALDAGLGRIALTAFASDLERGIRFEGFAIDVQRLLGREIQPGSVCRLDQTISDRLESKRSEDCGVS